MYVPTVSTARCYDVSRTSCIATRTSAPRRTSGVATQMGEELLEGWVGFKLKVVRHSSEVREGEDRGLASLSVHTAISWSWLYGHMASSKHVPETGSSAPRSNESM